MGPAALRPAGPPSFLDVSFWWAGARSELVPPYFEKANCPDPSTVSLASPVLSGDTLACALLLRYFHRVMIVICVTGLASDLQERQLQLSIGRSTRVEGSALIRTKTVSDLPLFVEFETPQCDAILSRRH